MENLVGIAYLLGLVLKNSGGIVLYFQRRKIRSQQPGMGLFLFSVENLVGTAYLLGLALKNSEGIVLYFQRRKFGSQQPKL